MKKRIISLVLCLTMLIPGFSASALFKTFKNGDPFQVPQNPRQIPNDIYVEPYMPTQNITVYAPWLKNFHAMSQDEYDAGTYGGEACQQVRQLEISPVNPDIMYFGTDTSGIYKTTNGGKNWYNVTNHTAAHCTKGLWCDPFDENIVYAAFRSIGFFRSKDGARTWEFVLKDTDHYKVGPRADTIVTDAAGNYYLAAGSGIWRIDRKTDAITCLTPQFRELTGTKGVTWRDLDVSADGQYIFACAIEDVNTTIENGIYASYDAGKTWQIISNNDEQVFNAYSVAIHPEDKNHIFFSGTYTDRKTGKNTTAALFESFDAGKTSETIFGHIYENLPEGVKATVKGIHALQFGPKRDNGQYDLYYSALNSTYPIRVSHDYGRTFEQVYKASDRIGENTIRMDYETGKTYTGWLYQAFDIDEHDPDHVVFAASGIYDKRGDKITRISAGFSGVAIVAIAKNSQGRAFMPAMDVGAFITDSAFETDNLPAVKDNTSANGRYYANAIVDPNDDNHLICYIGSANGSGSHYGIRESFDFGETTNPMHPDTAIPKKEVKYGNAKVLQYDEEDSNIIYMSYHNSYDNGKTWVRNKIDEQDAFLLDIQDNKPNRFIAITGTGADTKLYLSEDKGKTWKYIMSPGFSDFGRAIINAADDNEIWYTNKRELGKIFLDSGTKQTQTSLLGVDYFNELAQNPDNPNHWLVGSVPGLGNVFNDFKIAETLDGGKSWHAVPGLWSSQIHEILFQKGTTEVFFATMGGLMIYDYAKYQEYLNSKVTIVVNGKAADYSEQPVIDNNRVMVPMRELFEQLGATVNYNEETGVISANKDGNYVTLTAGTDTAIINGEEYKMEITPYISEKGKTMVPIRFAAEALDIGVGWNDDARMVYVNS